MISTDFASNENWDDAWVSFKLLFQPWRWKKGKELEMVKKEILRQFFNSSFNQFHIFLFLTGRSALFTILQSLQLPKDSEVVVQAFTCEAVILPILANALKPVYCDIETQSLSMNPIELEKKITPKTKVVILQHTFGMTPAQSEKIQAIVKQHNLLLIQDIAHGYSNLNSKFKSLNSIFLMSFGRSKALSSVFGGAIVTNDKIICNYLQRFSTNYNSKPMPSFFFIFRLLLYKPLAMLIKSTYDLGLGKLLHRLVNIFGLLVPEITQKEKRGEYEKILDKGYPNALAILLLNQLRKFEQIQQNRAFICEEYRKKISNIKNQISNIPAIRYPILVNNPQEILSKASRQNIFLGNWYNQVVAPKGIDLNKMKYVSGSCPVAEKICQKIINLPTNITLQQARRVLTTIVE